VILLDALEMDKPQTKEVIGILRNLGVDSSALILLPRRDEVILRSVRNLPKVRTLVAQYLNVRDLLKFDYILVPLASLDVIEGILG
jgi:large subunit ribosomal protein L2